VLESRWLVPRGYEAVEQVIFSGRHQERRSRATRRACCFSARRQQTRSFIGLFGTSVGIVTAVRELAGAAGNLGGTMNNVMSGHRRGEWSPRLDPGRAAPRSIAYTCSEKTPDMEENVAVDRLSRSRCRLKSHQTRLFTTRGYMQDAPNHERSEMPGHEAEAGKGSRGPRFTAFNRTLARRRDAWC